MNCLVAFLHGEGLLTRDGDGDRDRDFLHLFPGDYTRPGRSWPPATTEASAATEVSYCEYIVSPIRQ